MSAACVCGWPEKECLRRVLGNGPPFPSEPCEPKVEASPAAEVQRVVAWTINILETEYHIAGLQDEGGENIADRITEQWASGHDRLDPRPR